MKPKWRKKIKERKNNSITVFPSPVQSVQTPDVLRRVSSLASVPLSELLHCTLALVIDLFGGDNFVDDCLEEVILPCHPGWKTGDVQLLVANGVIQR